ncbi:MAG: response regulator, partial [Defluviitaleaceae bacterium]|nr:response regulator [Defluviitaleaceae bacterium]
IHNEEYVLTSLVNDVINIVNAQVANTGLKFTAYVDSRIPNMLMGDVVRLRQIILNLMSNAVKFTDEGYVSLSIEGERRGNSTNLIITVEDTGRGIKEEDINHIMQAFSQFDVKTIEGLGLGLAVTTGLLERMGGSLSVSSMYGLGSIFVVTLPQNISENGGDMPMCAVPDSDKVNVLVYDKRENCKTSLVRSLVSLGVRNKVVQDDDEFAAEMESGRYQFVFASAEMYGRFGAGRPDFKTDANIVLMADTGEVLGGRGEHRVLVMPIFCLPVAEVLDATHSREAGYRRGFTAPDARVLIVDDISANLLVAEGLLEPYNMLLDMCKSGEEAIEAVKAKAYDLILMDHMMPGMNGVETVAKIRQMGSEAATDCENVPIVVLTANAIYSSRSMIRRNGFDDYLPKPIQLGRLYDIAEKWIPREKQERSAEAAAPSGNAAEQVIQIEGIDTQKGLVLAGGNPDVYLKVIRKYYENGRVLLKELEHAAHKGDLENYEIHVHALRGVSASIGADALAEPADALERASEQKNLGFVRARTPELLERLEATLRNIGSSLEKDAATAHSLKGSDTPVAAKQKILMIDDSDSFILILNSILKEDYETLISLDGEDGLETAELTKPDLILLDVVMPGMSGYEVLEKLKASETLRHIPVILITGKKSEDSEAKGYALGAADFIRKPFDRATVREKVDKLMRR